MSRPDEDDTPSRLARPLSPLDAVVIGLASMIRERLGPSWGFLAGKIASCSAIALTLGAYAGNGHHGRLLAVVGSGRRWPGSPRSTTWACAGRHGRRG